MEVARLWRGQEQRYMGPGRQLFEYKVVGEGEQQERHLRCKLNGRSVILPEGGESNGLVEFLAEGNYNEETAAKLALELAATDPNLGLPFAEEVMRLLNQPFEAEPARVEVMRFLGYSDEAIIGWHFSVDGYAANTQAQTRLETLVRETAA
jgi:hypothetical protein